MGKKQPLRIIKRFSDGSYLRYGEGKFDDWCVYMINRGKKYFRPPKDWEYFLYLKKGSEVYGRDKIYSDFVRIYDLVTNEVRKDVLIEINRIAKDYGQYAMNFNKVYTILYLAMIAEENKANSILGKRVKRLGLYSILYRGMEVKDAADFMRGMGWKEIDEICRQCGF